MRPKTVLRVIAALWAAFGAATAGVPTVWPTAAPEPGCYIYLPATVECPELGLYQQFQAVDPNDADAVSAMLQRLGVAYDDPGVVAAARTIAPIDSSCARAEAMAALTSMYTTTGWMRYVKAAMGPLGFLMPNTVPLVPTQFDVGAHLTELGESRIAPNEMHALKLRLGTCPIQTQSLTRFLT